MLKAVVKKFHVYMERLFQNCSNFEKASYLKENHNMEQKKIVKEIIIGLFMAIVSVLIIAVFIPQQIQLATTFGEEIGVNSRTFPYFTAALIGVAAVIHLIVSIFRWLKIRKIKSEPQKSISEKNIHGEVLAIVIFLLFAAYAFMFSKFGYIVSSLVIPPIVLIVLKSKNVLHYISVYGFVALIFVIFQYLLKIQLMR